MLDASRLQMSLQRPSPYGMSQCQFDSLTASPDGRLATGCVCMRLPLDIRRSFSPPLSAWLLMPCAAFCGGSWDCWHFEAVSMAVRL